MKVKITLIHAFNVDPEIELQATQYAPPDTVYILTDKQTPDVWAKSVYQAEKERNDWIRKYDNLLKGIRYWESKAKELDNAE